MNPAARLKTALCGFFAECVVSEVAVEIRVLFLTRLPNLLFPWRWFQFLKVRKQTGIKVNIGCGPLLDPGWTGIDYRSPNASIRCDIKRGLPFQDGACRFVFSEHVFEHLDLRELRCVLRECYRVLEPGGVVRIIMPSLEAYVSAYMTQNDAFIRTVLDRQVSRAEMLNGVFQRVTHRFIHDFPSIQSELLAAGFSAVYHSSFRSSSYPELNIDCDLPGRKAESFYVEAVK
jgi:predicted SAM-dependent methyltransferase